MARGIEILNSPKLPRPDIFLVEPCDLASETNRTVEYPPSVDHFLGESFDFHRYLTQVINELTGKYLFLLGIDSAQSSCLKHCGAAWEVVARFARGYPYFLPSI